MVCGNATVLRNVNLDCVGETQQHRGVPVYTAFYQLGFRNTILRFFSAMMTSDRRMEFEFKQVTKQKSHAYTLFLTCTFPFSIQYEAASFRRTRRIYSDLCMCVWNMIKQSKSLQTRYDTTCLYDR